MEVNFKTTQEETLVKLRMTTLKKGNNVLEIDKRTFGIMEQEIKDRKLKIEITELKQKEVVKDADKEEG